MSKFHDAERYLRTSEHPITVRELAEWLRVGKSTAGDYLHQLQRRGRAQVAGKSGTAHLWEPAHNPPDPTARTKKTRAADRRAIQAGA